MSIGINIFPLLPAKNGGAEQFILRMLNGLDRYKSPFDFLVFTGPHNEHLFSFESSHMRKVILPFDVSCYKEHEQGFISEIGKYSIELMHYPQSTIFPLSLSCPCLLTVLDIQHEYYPQFFPDRLLEIRNTSYRRSAIKAKRIIAISDFTRKTIVEKFDIPDDSIDVIYPFVERQDHQPSKNNNNVKKAVEKLKLPDEYIIYPAGSWPHKNHLKLLHALKHLKENGQIIPLVLTGIADSFETIIEEEVIRLGLESQVFLLGYLSQTEFAGVFKQSMALVYPSLFEGFGMPIIEAMLASVPVICSQTTCLPEVALDAAVMFDPEDHIDIARKIELVWTNEKLRSELIVRGLRRSQQLCCSNETEKLFAVYQQMLNQSGHEE